MSATESSRTLREQGRSFRHVSLIQGNVIALVFRSLDPGLLSPTPRTSYKFETLDKDSGGDEIPDGLLKAFVDANKSSMNKKLVECLDEVRIVGWIAPKTLLVCGPNEDLEVLKTAWRERILRNPKGFLLKDVGRYFISKHY